MARSRISRRLSGAIVLTALIPLLGAVILARQVIQQTSDRFFRPEIGARLDEALGLYQELARSEKSSMGFQATAIAEGAALRAAAAEGDAAGVEAELKRAVRAYPSVASLAVENDDGVEIAHADRGRPVDEATEYQLQIERPLAVEGEGPRLFATFAADRARFDGLDRMSQFVELYSTIADRRKEDERAYVWAFAVLLGLTILGAIFIGTQLARGVSARIARLAVATRKVGAGDLSAQVPERGTDEIGDLARAFNRMLVEVETSRARIEYLQRIGAWQEMARRLAHEIKNPLTPIQLAVEEIHQRYSGSDAAYQKLLDDALEVVQAEVGTLRRLVTEFSDFARLPQAHLERSDLTAFLREQEAQTQVFDWTDREGQSVAEMHVEFETPEGPALAYLDRHMMRRVLINLLRNSAQAIAGAGRAEGVVRIRLARSGDFWILDVDDDGPGVEPDHAERIFDPYVTTKDEGTGLGLAIVKKIVVEHGGTIQAVTSPSGGARMRIRIPVLGTPAGAVALEAQARAERTSSAPELVRLDAN